MVGAGHERVLVTALPPSRRPGAVPTAPVGRLLAHRLLEAGLRVRVLVPSAEADGWPVDAEVVDGTVAEPSAAEEAFVGIDRAFIAGLVGVEYDRMRELTNLLLAGPVSRVVVLSSHGSEFETWYSPETWQWLAFERALQLAEASWVHIRPAGLFANVTEGGYPISGAYWKQAVAARTPIREFLPETAYPYVDEADVAEVAARLLVGDPDPDEQITGKLDVVGCLSSARERVDCLNDVLGIDLRLEPLRDEDEARRYWQSQGWPNDIIAVTLFAMQAFHHASEETRRAVRSQIATTEALLGRRARSFRDWLSDHASAL